MADIVIAGFGGQGVLTAGLILINAAAAKDKNVTWISSYGAEMRGGTASCSVVISDDEIGSPYPIELDILVAMNSPSYDKFIGKCAKAESSSLTIHLLRIKNTLQMWKSTR